MIFSMDNNQNNNGVTNVTPSTQNVSNNGVNSANQYNNDVNFTNQYNNGNIPSQFVQQPLHNEQSTNNSNNNFNKEIASNRKSKNKLVLVIILGIMVALGIVVFFCLKKNDATNKEFDINYSTSFFVKDSNGKYALFNDDGKKLTDFAFTSTSNFVNGTALVKKDDAYGIINANGKMTTDFGKYEYITTAAGMYQVRSDNHYYLINGDGKILYDMENMDLDTFIGVGTYSLLEDKNSMTYKVLNYEGKIMISFPINKNAEDDPSTNEKDGYVSIFYNNKNYILNPMTGKEIVSFDSNLKYCISNIEENGKIITLNSCVPWYQSQEKTYHKLFKDGKLYDLADKCEEFKYSDGFFVCTNDYQNYLLDSNLNIGINTSSKAYIDNNTYAMEKAGSFNGVDFYSNGSIVKNVECRVLKENGYMKNGLYILGTYYSNTCGTDFGTYEYYKSNGENAFGKSFARAEKFDKNGLAKVSDDKKSYYLIDANGKKISQDYDNILLNLDYYIVTKDDLEGIIDKDGKVVADCLYSRINITENQNKKYATLITSDKKYIIYDLEKKSELLTLDSSPSFNLHYISVSKGGKNIYYTYKGNMFYETN